MKKTLLLTAVLAVSMSAAIRAATLEIPTTTVLGTDVFSGPTFAVSGNFTATDDINVTAFGTVDLASGAFTANAAGILISPPVANTGATPGEISLEPDGFPFAALMIGNSALGFFPLFPANTADGL